MKLIYVASPYAGDVEKNIAFAKRACRYVMEQGHAFFAPHLLYPQILDDTDPEERKAGMKFGIRILEICDELWVCGDRISTGMEMEIELAKQLGIPIRYVSEEQILGTLQADGKEIRIIQEGRIKIEKTYLQDSQSMPSMAGLR